MEHHETEKKTTVVKKSCQSIRDRSICIQQF